VLDADNDDAIALLTVATPWGPASLAVGRDGVHAVGLLASEADVAASLGRRVGRPLVPLSDAPRDTAAVANVARDDLERYAAEPAAAVGWTVPIRLDGMSRWDRAVLGAVARIPYGTTASYGEIARAAGSPGAARAAGGAVGRNPIGLMIPCHRVIAGDGTIGGYGGSWPADRDALVALKRALLAHEGVEVR